jgi:hypothetical protein
VAESGPQRFNRWSHAINTDWREMGDDIDAFFFLDEPLRLSRYPVP